MLVFGSWGLWHSWEYFQRHSLETFRPRSRKVHPAVLWVRFSVNLAIAIVGVMLVGFGGLEAIDWFMDIIAKPTY